MQIDKRNEFVWILCKLQGDTEFLPVAFFSANGGAGSTSFYSKGGSENLWRKKKGRK